jgi:hypothetical protein
MQFIELALELSSELIEVRDIPLTGFLIGFQKYLFLN